jgi:TRAP-type uncharacterized transport system fused permease subunit
MNKENLIKSWFTSLIGAVAMSLALFGWWFDQLTDWQGISLFCIGFMLLWMKDKISAFIEETFKVALNKYSKK